MPFLDFFRNLFDRGPAQEPPRQRLEDERQQYRNSFRNPIWQNDEDEDDISDFSNRIPRRFQMRVFPDPSEIVQIFETELDDMMRGFFGFGNNSSIFEHFKNDFSNALPMPDEQPRIKGPRDEVVKPSYDMPEPNFGFGNFSRIFALPDKKSNDSLQVLDPFYTMPDSNTEKLDSDLDGKIKPDELAKFWKHPSTGVESFPRQSSTVQTSMTVITKVMPDGSVEKHSVVKDKDGTKETRVTRQIGDQMHTIVTKKAADGSEIKSEDIVNMDENELKGFNEKWKKTGIRQPKDDTDLFPWHKFFGPNPKL